MSTDLAAWLLEQIAEDERAARKAVAAVGDGRVWHVTREKSSSPTPFRLMAGATNLISAYDSEGYDMDEVVAEHIARWDPARVLAECDAKKEIVEWCSDWRANEFEIGPVLRLLALPYAYRSGYREEWRP